MHFKGLKIKMGGVGFEADRLDFLLLLFFLLPAQVSELSITGRDQTEYTLHAGFCMFPQSCDLRTETAGSL
jgi:hypothetical protein